MSVPHAARMAAPCIAVVLLLGVAAAGEPVVCPSTPFDIRGEYYVATLSTSDGIAMTAGDWNEDGKPDLAAIGGGGVLSILLGQGGYRLCPPATIALTHTCLQITQADLDGDGHRDLVACGLDTTTFLR